MVETATTADIHLKRAYGFLQEVEKATEKFRRDAVAHDSQVNSNEPFLRTFRNARDLKQQKSALVNDLQLASQEVDRAGPLNQDAAVQTPEGRLGATQLRAMIAYSYGQIEMIWGTSDNAKRFFVESLQITEFPGAHYMLGLLFESEYRTDDALVHFEKCLDLDPGGELSVPALREANAMRNYKKAFRGNWGVFLVLLVLFFPAAFLYFFVKRK